MRQLDSITDTMDINLSKLWETVEDREACNAMVHGVAERQTWLSDWTTAITSILFYSFSQPASLAWLNMLKKKKNVTYIEFPSLHNFVAPESADNWYFLSLDPNPQGDNWSAYFCY